jgi:hypothetical protein
LPAPHSDGVQFTEPPQPSAAVLLQALPHATAALFGVQHAF